MPNEPRALIIAIEKYPSAQGLAQELPNTAAAGLNFYNWLTQIKGVQPQNIWYCGDAVSPPGLPASNFSDTSYAKVRRALINLVTAGRDKTSEVYVFFSGHGLSWKDDPHERPVDVFVASDFANLQTDGNLCAKWAEIEVMLETSLGGADHYFFIDACRNVIPGRMANIGSLALALDPAELGEPTRYRIYSTSSGQVAVINSNFARFLGQGLKGEGRAKIQQNGHYWVRFDRLFRYVQQGVGDTQPMEFKSEGKREGLIYQVPDPVLTRCQVIVEDGQPGETFEIKVVFGPVKALVVSEHFCGPTFTRDFPPLEPGYLFEVSSGAVPLVQVFPDPGAPVDLYEPTEIRFRKQGSIIPPPPPLLPLPQVSFTTFSDSALASDTNIRLTNLATGESIDRGSTFIGELAPGPWNADVLFKGQKIQRTAVTLGRGDIVNLDLTRRPENRTIYSIAARLPTSEGGRAVWISETLGGPVVESDSALWLALIGAGRILQPPGHYSKIESLKLDSFEDVAPQTGVIYALFGSEVSHAAQLRISDTTTVDFRPVTEMESVMEAKLAPPLGQHFVTFGRDGQRLQTYATVALPNRATFLVFTEDRQGRLRTQQFLLPLYHLVSFLPNTVAELVLRETSGSSFGSLKMMRLLSNAQQRFFARRDMSGATTNEDRAEWDSMLHSKWVEPLVAVMAGFEMLRQDRNNPVLHIVADNLRTYFNDIPDVQVFTALFERRRPDPAGTPLLRDTLMQVANYADRLPYAVEQFDYDSPLTSWVGELTSSQTAESRRQEYGEAESMM